MKKMSVITTGALVFLLCLIAIARPPHASNPAAIESQSNAAQLYAQNCARCHGKDGQAKGLKARAVRARNLTDAEWHDRVSDERLFNSINNGKGKMPAYSKKLSEAEIDSLVEYVRSLKK